MSMDVSHDGCAEESMEEINRAAVNVLNGTGPTNLSYN